MRLLSNGPALSLDGVALGDSRDHVIRLLGTPEPVPGGDPLLYRNGELEIYMDRNSRIITVAGGLHLRQAGRLLLSVGDRDDRILSVMGHPNRERYRQAPWYGHVRYYDTFHFKVYSRERSWGELLDVTPLLTPAGRGAYIMPLVRGMVLGGPYFDS